MRVLTATALGLLLIGNANAYNVLIDFEDSPLNGDYNTVGYDLIESRGFNFSGTYFKGVTNWPLGPVDDSKALNWCPDDLYCDYSEITMTQDGMVAFDLISLELARYTSADIAINFHLTGHFVGGGTITTSILVNSTTLNNFVLGSGWTNLQGLTIYAPNTTTLDLSAAVAVDNILVSTVPIPAAVWLFASGLGLLGWMRRKA
jgi:hypothetical protein